MLNYNRWHRGLSGGTPETTTTIICTTLCAHRYILQVRLFRELIFMYQAKVSSWTMTAEVAQSVPGVSIQNDCVADAVPMSVSLHAWRARVHTRATCACWLENISNFTPASHVIRGSRQRITCVVQRITSLNQSGDVLRHIR